MPVFSACCAERSKGLLCKNNAMAKDRENKAKAVMTANGRIEYLLMKTDDDYQAEYFAILLELLMKMPPYTRFILYCTSEQKRAEAAAFLRASKFLRFRETGSNIRPARPPKCMLIAPTGNINQKGTPWIRDTFFVKWDSSTQTAFLSETASQRGAEKDLAEFLEQSGDIFPKVEAGPDFMELPLVGGNVLLVDQYVLVGYQDTNGMPRAELERQVKNLFNTMPDTPFQTVLVVGEPAAKKIPEFLKHLFAFFKDSTPAETRSIPRFADMFLHLDMFLTVAGVKGANQKPVLFLARAECLCTLSNTSDQEQKILSVWNAYMDLIDQELEPHFDVRRNPVPLFIEYRPLNEDGKNILRIRPVGIFFGAYNNCLVEVSEGTRRVWLPGISRISYYSVHRKALDAIEQKNREMWEGLDFEVSVIEADFYKLLLGYSALHCITNELARG
jgi:hypothetical protein